MRVTDHVQNCRLLAKLFHMLLYCKYQVHVIRVPLRVALLYAFHATIVPLPMPISRMSRAPQVLLDDKHARGSKFTSNEAIRGRALMKSHQHGTAARADLPGLQGVERLRSGAL